MRLQSLGPLHTVARGLFAVVTLVLANKLAAATDLAHVRVVLHTAGSVAAPITFVDISVEGTAAPIRLVRRIEGTCAATSRGTEDDGPLVSVECSTTVRFDVARVGREIVVRRTLAGAAPDAGLSAPDDATAAAMQVIARAVLPPRTDVRVD